MTEKLHTVLYLYSSALVIVDQSKHYYSTGIAFTHSYTGAAASGAIWCPASLKDT